MTPSTHRRAAPPRPARTSIAMAALLALSAAPLAAPAAVNTFTWKGGQWSNNTSWAEKVAPPANGLTSARLVFGTSSTVLLSLPSAYSVYSLTFSSGASAYTFQNSALTLGAGGLTQNAANAQTFNNPVLLGADQTWTLGGGAAALSFAGGVNTTAGGTDRTLTISTATTTGSGNTVNGVISGGGSLTKTGAGLLTLTAANTYTGDTTVSAGTLALGSGARIKGGNLSVRDGGALTISGTGSVTPSGSLALGGAVGPGGSRSTVNLGGSASLSTGNAVYIGYDGSGTFNQSGGSFSTAANKLFVGYLAGSDGSYNLSGSASLSTGIAHIGSTGAGTFNQGGGSFSTNGYALYLGDAGSGAFNLSGGNLSTGFAYVGNGGSGTFNQSGGSFSTNGNWLYVGYGSAGTYNLSGDASKLSTGNAFVGYDGSGAFSQTGGSFTTNGKTLYLGYNAGVSGTYSLGGGTLTTGSVRGVSGTSTFNFNGGTLQAGAGTTGFMLGLTTANVQSGGAKVDSNGFNVTIAQSLVHDTTGGAPAIDGGLTKLGAGTLTLTGTNTFTGNVTINAGTLAAASEASLGTGQEVNVGSGATLVFNGSSSLTRTYNLGLSTLTSGSGNTLTIGSGGTLNGGFLAGSGSIVLTDGATLNATRAGTGTVLSQTAGTVAFNNVLMTGTSRFAQAAGATLNTTGDFTANPQTTLVVNGAVNLKQGGSIAGAFTINNGGVVTTRGNASEALYLSGSRTTINSGGALSAAFGTAIELNGGLLVNNGTQSGVLDVSLGGVAKGRGVFGTVNVNDGGKFSPGNSPGTATVSSLGFGAGGSYQYELNTANPSFGSSSDLLKVLGNLSINAGTTADSWFTIDLDSLNLFNQAAALTDFDSSHNYHWLLVDADSVSGFDSSKFYVDTSGFYNSLNGGSFSVDLNGDDLYLDFNPAAAVPEPSSWALLLAGVAVVGGLQARRRHVAQR